MTAEAGDASVTVPIQMDDRLIDRLRLDLDAAGFTVDGLATAWGESAAAALGRAETTPALLALDRAPVTPIATLGRLFVLGATAWRRDLASALPALGIKGAITLGLVAPDPASTDAMRPRVDIRPYAVADDEGLSRWWIVSDLGEAALAAGGGELPEEHVLGAGSASSTLAALLVPTGHGRVLDLGTGSGIQALHAVRTAAAVVATDISARALAFADVNARLNGVHLDLRHGSLYEPVSGERFDRIVSNPPFVITPRGLHDVPNYTYRDGGLVGDALVERVMRGAADHLTPGGIAQSLLNWEVHGDEIAARERVLGWASSSGLDVWIVQRDLVDPAEYAETWVRDGGTRPGSARWRALVTAWLHDFADRGVTAIGIGYATARRPATGRATLRRFEVLAGPLGGSVGLAIAAGLTGHDAQAARDDRALAAARFRVAPDVTEHRHYWPGDADPTVIELRQGAGFARVRRVDTVLAAVVGACDGELSLGAITDAVARLLEADPAELRAAALVRVRELLVEGFVTLID